jgi:alkaline phosphatase D
MANFSRRDFVLALSAAGLTPAALAAASPARSGDAAGRIFAQGVASGDPLHDRVILWTRISPRRLSEIVAGRWTIALDPGMRRVRGRGFFLTDVTRDFTVKIDAKGLEPGRTYYYRFETPRGASPVGRTRTLPLGSVSTLRMAFASCSNFPFGFFNAYARIAERNDLDFVLHLGDYLYEYELGGFADPALAGRRDVTPVNEIVALTDYRLRHALYKSDPDLQEAHRQHPFICVWDDHESTNDSWENGAENHNPEAGEGDWQVRKRRSIRAYNEYMPIRSTTLNDDKIFRRFRVGDLADLIMLDTRLNGRDLQAAAQPGQGQLPADGPVVADPQRTLLGFDQEQWLEQQLNLSKRRGARWRVLGQQVMMAQLSSNLGRTIINSDQWDGYRAARERLYGVLREGSINNNVVLTGDIHSSWCNELTSNPYDAAQYDPATGRGAVGVEFVCPGVTSPGVAEAAAPTVAAQLRAVSPHVKFVELSRRGYGILDLNRERAQGEIYHVPTVSERVGGEQLATAFATETGSNVLRVVSSPAPGRAIADPAPADDQ